MVILDRPIKFEEVDAAGIVFFAHFMRYAHEAMEAFFSPLQGGYAGLIVTRRIGLPSVRAEVDFVSPLRYGEALRIETSVTRIGRRSATLRYQMFRAHDEVLSADLWQTIVTTDLETLTSCPMPDDVRGLLSAHLEFEPPPSSAAGRSG